MSEQRCSWIHFNRGHRIGQGQLPGERYADAKPVPKAIEKVHSPVRGPSDAVCSDIERCLAK